jgi:hypothetical protein
MELGHNKDIFEANLLTPWSKKWDTNGQFELSNERVPTATTQNHE